MTPAIIISTKDLVLVDELNSVLSGRDFSVYVCDSRMSSIYRILDQRIDILILDLEKPDKDSLEFIRIIKKTRPNIPIIVFAENPDITIVIEFYNLGVFYWSLKPISSNEIQMIIDAAESKLNYRKTTVNNGNLY